MDDSKALILVKSYLKDVHYKEPERAQNLNNRTVKAIKNAFDKVILEIWSNGSIDVTTALSPSAQLLIDHFMQIAAISGQPVVVNQPSQVVEDTKDEAEEPTTSITIEELELSVRAYNCLKRASINSMAELLKKSENDLLNIKNFGKKSSDEVIERLHHFGLDLAPSPEVPEEEMV